MLGELKLYPPTWDSYFPHMSAQDRPLWLRFLADAGGEWSSFAYDVAVGGCECPDSIQDPGIRTAWKWNTSKRIDALGFKGDQIGLFEVRPSAGVSAIGALVSYRFLLAEELQDVRPVRLYLVTDVIADDTLRVAGGHQITVLVYTD